MRREEGFTLLEVLTAMAVLSIAVLALLKAGDQDLRTVAHVEAKEMASIVAENQLNTWLLRPVIPARTTEGGIVQMGERDWQWQITVTPTTKAGIVSIHSEVSLKGETQVLAELTGFRRTRS